MEPDLAVSRLFTREATVEDVFGGGLAGPEDASPAVSPDGGAAGTLAAGEASEPEGSGTSAMVMYNDCLRVTQ